ncbi:hypothetical protein [Fusobacterium sp. PH5-44]|uniref:hypothetical protein n=1 Tax=unclassified Fusobacterium TaxID=2648384 RepID=UPI003D1FB2BB
MFLFNMKGHGFTAIIIQAIFAMVALFWGMINEEMVWGKPILRSIFPALCVLSALILCIPLLYLLQKWLDKKGRIATDSVYGLRPLTWGILSSAGLLIIITIAAGIQLIF